MSLGFFHQILLGFIQENLLHLLVKDPYTRTLWAHSHIVYSAMCGEDMLAAQKTPWNSSLSSWLTSWWPSLELLHCVPLDGWLGGDKTSLLCFSSISKGTIANPTNNLFLVSNSTIFFDRKTEVLPHFAFAGGVLSHTEEVEDFSVAIFTTWCLAFVHLHVCLGAHGMAGQGLSVNTVYVLIAYHNA